MAVKVQLFEHIDIEHFYLDVSNSGIVVFHGISMSKTDFTVSVVV